MNGLKQYLMNSTEGDHKTILTYSNEIRSAILLAHGEKAHSCYFSRDAYADMIKDSKYTDDKELMIIPDAVHTDLYHKRKITRVLISTLFYYALKCGKNVIIG